jgi:hypothetical protein
LSGAKLPSHYAHLPLTTITSFAVNVYPNVVVSNTIVCVVTSLGVQVYTILSIYWPLINTSNSFLLATVNVTGLTAANAVIVTVDVFKYVAICSVKLVR